EQPVRQAAIERHLQSVGVRAGEAVPQESGGRTPILGEEGLTRPAQTGRGRGADVQRIELVSRLCADVSDINDEVAGEFALDEEIPRLDITTMNLVGVRRSHIDRAWQQHFACAEIRPGKGRDAFVQRLEWSACV